MLLLTIEITNRNAMKILHSMEERHLIKIVDDAERNSASLPGAPLSLNAFKSWIKDAEGAATISLKEARIKWMRSREHLKAVLK